MAKCRLMINFTNEAELMNFIDCIQPGSTTAPVSEFPVAAYSASTLDRKAVSLKDTYVLERVGGYSKDEQDRLSKTDIAGVFVVARKERWIRTEEEDTEEEGE